jgi:outer membrane protein assembly factor BamA
MNVGLIRAIPALIFLFGSVFLYAQRPLVDTTIFRIDSIAVTGNRITNIKIILRELPVKKGDSITALEIPKLIEKGKENLTNTLLFNFITIDTLSLRPGGLVYRVNVAERWYLWPFPIFEISDRNFNSWWQKKDLSRINYGVYLVYDNFRGRHESIKLLLRFGFDQRYMISYIKPWINRSQTLGLSGGIGFSRNHTVAWGTLNDKLQYYKSGDAYAYKNLNAGIKIKYRKGSYSTHAIALYYDHYSFSDTLLRLNPDFAPGPFPEYFTLDYSYIYDSRDYQKYPLKGNYLNFEIEKKGLGILKDEKLDLTKISLTGRIYRPLGHGFYCSAAFLGRIGWGTRSSYFAKRGLGFESEIVRSFEYYVVDGDHFALLKTQLKYQLVKTRILHLKFLPLSKFNKIPLSFYLNIFYDGGYINNSHPGVTETMSNRYLQGGGIGIDFVTYYDQVIRIDYAMNMFLEQGIFLHFIAPF